MDGAIELVTELGFRPWKGSAYRVIEQTRSSGVFAATLGSRLPSHSYDVRYEERGVDVVVGPRLGAPPFDCGQDNDVPVVTDQLAVAAGWSLHYDLTDDDGLAVRDVSALGRYMASKFSVPYVSYGIAGPPDQRAELVAFGPAGPDRGLLERFSVSAGPSELILRADYEIPTTLRTCLTVSQEYSFRPVIAGEDCGATVLKDPAQCSRFTRGWPISGAARRRRVDSFELHSACISGPTTASSMWAPWVPTTTSPLRSWRSRRTRYCASGQVL